MKSNLLKAIFNVWSQSSDLKDSIKIISDVFSHSFFLTIWSFKFNHYLQIVLATNWLVSFLLYKKEEDGISFGTDVRTISTGALVSNSCKIWTLNLRISCQALYRRAAIAGLQVGNCCIRAEQKITAINETNWYKI